MPDTTQTTQRIAVFISGRGSNLKTLIENDHKRNISLVVSDIEGAPGLQHAKDHNIPHVTLPFKSFSHKQEFEETLLKTLKEHHISFIFLAGFMRILSANFIMHFPMKILNIHPSLLPKFKGLNTHQRAIDAKEKEHGCTVHFVTPELDDGPSLIQSRVPLYPEDTSNTLAERVLKQEHIIFPMALSYVVDHKISFIDGVPYIHNQRAPLIVYEKTHHE